MNIGKKITLTCMAPLAAVVAVGGISIFSMRAMNRTVHRLATGSLPGIHSIGRLSGFAKDIRGGIRGHITANKVADKTKADADLAQLEQGVQAEIRAYEETIETPQEHALFVTIPEGFRELLATAPRVRPLSEQLKTQEAMEIFRSQTMPAYLRVQTSIEKVDKFKKEAGDRAAAITAGAAVRGQWLTCGLLVLSFLASGLTIWRIVGPINAVLGQSMAELAALSAQTSQAARQMSGSSQSLSEGATEQAASLEQTSAATTQIGSMIQKNAGGSREAADIMAKVEERVSRANDSLAAMLQSMEQITASSGKISRIIQVIEDIAFQTNILALNAAVEAARAGESGMGFAVVADEVRNLAQRSAQAAQDTTTLIQESVSSAGEGSARLQQVAAALRGVTGETQQVRRVVEEVSSGSQEQARGMQQIARGVAQMEQVTQRTAAYAEQSAAAGEELGTEAGRMHEVVEQLQRLVTGTASGD